MVQKSPLEGGVVQKTPKEDSIQKTPKEDLIHLPLTPTVDAAAYQRTLPTLVEE